MGVHEPTGADLPRCDALRQEIFTILREADAPQLQVVLEFIRPLRT